MTNVLNLRFLGSPQISLDARPLNGFVSNKALALLIYMFVSKRTQSRQVLADLFWGDMPDREANANLRVVLSNLRQLIGSHLVITRTTVALDESKAYSLDVDVFRSTVTDSVIRSPEDMRSAQEMIDLYQGEFLEGFHVRDAAAFEEWALWQRDQFRQLAMQTLYRLSVYCAERGNYAAGLAYTSRSLALEPWQEEAHRQMMLLLHLSGNRSGALAQFELCQRILTQELQVEPMEETKALYERIKAANGARPSDVRPSNSDSFLHGRENEHAWLIGQWKLVRNQREVVTLVEGDAGIGKTSLLNKVLDYVAETGPLILHGTCHDFASDVPYQPMIDILRIAAQREPVALKLLTPPWVAELAQLLPELHESAQSKKTAIYSNPGEAARSRLFEAVARLLQAMLVNAAQHADTQIKADVAARQCWLILFLDDLQWMDQGTADLLRFLIYRLQGYPIWFLGAYQLEAMEAMHPLLRLRQTLTSQSRAQVLRLEPLDRAAVARWMRSLHGFDLSQAELLTDYVMQGSQGNPFVIQQLVQEVRQQALSQNTNGSWRLPATWPPPQPIVPFAVREMIQRRMAPLSPSARNILRLAVQAGSVFDPRSLYDLGATTGEMEEGLRECLQRGVIKQRHSQNGRANHLEHPVSQPSFEFAHGLMREVAGESLLLFQPQ